MPGPAEHLEILLAVADDLLTRLYGFRNALPEPAELSIDAKIAKRLADKFPTLVDTVKDKDAGAEAFRSSANAIA